MVSSKSLALLGILALALFAPAFTAAQTKRIHIAHRFKVSGEPQRGLVVLTEGERILATAPAFFIAHEGGECTVVAEAAIPESSKNVSALITAQTKIGDFFSTTVKLPTPLFASELAFDLTRVKAWSNEKKAELKALEVEEQTLGGQVQQLERKGKVSAAGARNESEAGGGLASVQASLRVAQSRLTTVQAAAPPPNYKRREAELAAYLNTLSTELKLARDGGGAILSDASQEVADKRALVEATKEEHLDLLEDELARLRRQREQVERER